MDRKRIIAANVKLPVVMLIAVAAVFSVSVCAGAGACAAEWNVIHTSNDERSDICVSAGRDSVIIKLPETPDYNFVRVSFKDESGSVVGEAVKLPVVGGEVSLSFADYACGTYYLQLARAESENGKYSEMLFGRESVKISKSESGICLVPSDVYPAFSKMADGANVPVSELYYYMKPTDVVQSDESSVAGLAKSITGGISSAYEKVRAVHDWVANNIYYDQDAVDALAVSPEVTWPLDACVTYSVGRSVCEGYANLTTALLRASGIPARTVLGYALSGGDDQWNSRNSSGMLTNHAWNEAYVDGRWIVMDTTWDSRNIYYKKLYNSNSALNKYFDCTLEFFSYDHLQTGMDDVYDPAVMPEGFSDLDGHWGRDYIKFAIDNNIMNGMGGGIFAPDGITTQAMFITILARFSGDSLPVVPGGRWYAGCVKWAEDNGILEGLEGFDPDAVITREQMAVIAMNFADHMGLDLPRQYEVSFDDGELISEYAREAVISLASGGILLGRENNMFAPDGVFTRAETCTVLMRLADRVLKDYLSD